MGLKCSQWLNANAYVRYDWETKKFVDERPRTVPPVPKEIDNLAAQAQWYLTGRIMTLMLLDPFLRQVAASTTGVHAEQATQTDVISGLSAVNRLCREGLEKRRDEDVAEVIDFHLQDAMIARIGTIKDLLKGIHAEGRRQGEQSR
jgi:hypothetical protein